MNKIVIKTVLFLCSLSLSQVFLHANSFEEKKKAEMIQDLEVIRHHYELNYAPADWKREYAGWDLNLACQEAKNQVLATPAITTKQFQQIIRNFLKSMKDYHVDALFASTESAALPFVVKGAEGRCFIQWIDPIRLPEKYFGIRAGDEVLFFDERPIEEVLEDLSKHCGKSSNPQTDRSLAELKLTKRTGRTGDTVPQGPMMLTTRSKETGQTITHQLMWNYEPEEVKNPFDFQCLLESIFGPARKLQFSKNKHPFFHAMMINPLHEIFLGEDTVSKYGLGSRKSFLPPLGEVICEEVEEDDWNSFIGDAYIYRNENGILIGYIRIPHYSCFPEDLEKFGKIIDLMQWLTQGLVIDQLNNPGGKFFICYELASMLTNRPLKTAYHRQKITEKDVENAHRLITFLKEISENEFAILEEQENFQRILFMKSQCENLLRDWNQGMTLTRPKPIEGVDQINPHSTHRYTKPILVLVNELDISCGDFFPAILKDNQRATLFGTRTSGTGGAVEAFSFINRHGIELCSYTKTIAERENSEKIENLGVSPDIEYQVTADDIQNGYKGYIQAVNEAIQTMIEKATTEQSN